MPMLTTFRIRFPVWPVQRPSRTRVAKSAMRLEYLPVLLLPSLTHLLGKVALQIGGDPVVVDEGVVDVEEKDDALHLSAPPGRRPPRSRRATGGGRGAAPRSAPGPRWGGPDRPVRSRPQRSPEALRRGAPRAP